jgi:hypothetical protein
MHDIENKYVNVMVTKPHVSDHLPYVILYGEDNIKMTRGEIMCSSVD